MGIHAGFMAVIKSCPGCGGTHALEFQCEYFGQHAKWNVGDRLCEGDWKYFPPDDFVEEYEGISSCSPAKYQHIFLKGTIIIVGGVFKGIKDIAITT